MVSISDVHRVELPSARDARGVLTAIESERDVQILRDRVPVDRLLEVRFEDLVAEPVGELSKICQFMGLSYAPEIFDYVEGFYNRERMHSTLDYQSPEAYERINAAA